MGKLFHSEEFKSLIIYENLNMCVHQLQLNSIRTNRYLLQHDNDVILINPSDNNTDEIINAGFVKPLYVQKKDFFQVKMVAIT